MRIKVLLLVLLIFLGSSDYGLASAEDALPAAVKNLIRQKKVAEVEKEAAALSQAGNYFLAHLAYGEMFLLIGDLDKAESAFKKALELNPIGIEGKIGLARTLAVRHQTSQARQLLQDAILTSPHPERLYYEMGLILEAAGDMKGSMQLFEQGLERYFSKK